MTFFALPLFPPILLLGVDGHGALVWPPNWTDGQPIPLEQRLNSPNFCCSQRFWALSSMHRCPFNVSVFIILPHTQGGTKVLWGPTKMPALAGVTTTATATTAVTACRQTR